MVIQMNRTYDNASPTILFDIVMDTTACSPTVFDGLLAWANLYANYPSTCVSRRRSSHHRRGRRG
jgi:hypothetical protein